MSATAISAGACAVDITAPIGISMGGYGARQGVSTGIHDPLHVRCLVLSDGTTTIAIAICDLVGVGPDIVDGARELIEQETGIPAANVLVGATHTHSGPAGLRIGSIDTDFVKVTGRKVAGAVRLAYDRLQPVTLKFGTATVTTVGQNRRHPDGPIEPTARILLASPEAGGTPVATLVNYACHATVLEHDNLLYSADFPGATARFIERELGGTAIYVQGACGDINPVWMRHDFVETDRIGGILGAAAVQVAHELRPVGEGQWAVNLSWSEQTPADNPGTRLDPALAVAREVIEVPRRVLRERDVIAKEIESLEAKLAKLGPDDVDGRRAIRPRLNEVRMEYVFAGRGRAEPGQTEKAEVQAFRLAPDCVVVSLPGEFFVDIGRDIERQCGYPHVLIAGYANNYLGYVPTADEFPNGGYEVGCARFEPEAAAMITDAAVRTARSLRPST